MRFLIDENCSSAVIEGLASLGHDLLLARETAGATDMMLAEIAIGEGRIVVTEDYDFGDLAVRDAVAIPGVVLMALTTPIMTERAERLLTVVRDLGMGLMDHLTIIEAKRVRRRRLR